MLFLYKSKGVRDAWCSRFRNRFRSLYALPIHLHNNWGFLPYDEFAPKYFLTK